MSSGVMCVLSTHLGHTIGLNSNERPLVTSLSQVTLCIEDHTTHTQLPTFHTVHRRSHNTYTITYVIEDHTTHTQLPTF